MLGNSSRGAGLNGKSVGDLAERLQRALGDGYKVTEELGGGGMSRVFVARDLELGRDVVVKVLPPDLCAGLNIDRFRREIQLAARLQHPHIVPLLSAGVKDGLLYYTMPRVEGETLRARLARSGELPAGEALRILRDIADALEYAHSREVVHRDIKPDNILISGHHALVTDFGVAKALSAATGQGAITSVGVTIGTPAYMSPEQATADPMTDQRSDVYSLGVVGYELLTGRTPFHGGSAQQVLAAQITQTPVPLTRQRPNISPLLGTVIMRCLEKRPADRFQSAGDVLTQLEMVGTPSGETVPTNVTTGTTPEQAAWARRKAAILTGIVAVILIASLIAGRYLAGNRTEFDVGATSQVTNEPGVEITPALSPDGKMLAYAGGKPGRTSIFVRQLNGGEAIRLAVGIAPQWSPDGSTIAYVDSAGIAAVPALGGAPRRLVVNAPREFALSPVWSHDGKSLAYSQMLANGVTGTIWIANADGTSPRKILEAKEPHSLSWSPRDDRLAFVSGNALYVYSGAQFGNIAPSEVWIVGRDGAGAAALTDSIHHSLSPAWTADGEGILYVSNIRGGRDLYFQRLQGNHPDGIPHRLTTGLNIHGIAANGGDRIAYVVWNTRVGIWTVPFSRAGPVSVATAKQITSATERIEQVRVSPDGQWLAFDSDRSGNMDIYKIRVDGTGLQQLTRDPADEFRPAWSPDGQEIAFQTWRAGNRDSYVMSADGSSERIVASGPAHEWAGMWSPDGSQLAFESDRTGEAEIWIAPAKGGNPRRLTFGGGVTPRWSPDGKFIAYTTTAISAPGTPPSPVRVIPSAGGQARSIEIPRSLGRAIYVQGWSSDGKKILLSAFDPRGTPTIAQAAIDGSSASELVRFDDAERLPYDPFFSTDGKAIYFAIGRHESDIWVMELRKR